MCPVIQFNSIQFNSIQFNSIQFNSIQFVLPSNRKTYRVKQKQYTRFHTFTITNIDKHRNTQNQFINMNNIREIAKAGSSQKGGGQYMRLTK